MRRQLLRRRPRNDRIHQKKKKTDGEVWHETELGQSLGNKDESLQFHPQPSVQPAKNKPSRRNEQSNRPEKICGQYNFQHGSPIDSERVPEFYLQIPEEGTAKARAYLPRDEKKSPSQIRREPRHR